MVEKKSEYKSFLDDDKWYLTEDKMKDLIEKYDNKQISHEKLKITWEMHLQYIQRFKPKEFAELQIQVWQEMTIQQNFFQKMMKPSWGKK